MWCQVAEEPEEFVDLPHTERTHIQMAKMECHGKKFYTHVMCGLYNFVFPAQFTQRTQRFVVKTLPFAVGNLTSKYENRKPKMFFQAIFRICWLIYCLHNVFAVCLLRLCVCKIASWGTQRTKQNKTKHSTEVCETARGTETERGRQFSSITLGCDTHSGNLRQG